MCPRCGGRAVGRVGAAQYYCWDCCVEYTAGDGTPCVFALDEEGELVPLAPGDGAAPVAQAALA